MWNIIKRREFATMFYRTEGNYRMWVIEHPNEYEVVVYDLSSRKMAPVFNKGGYATFYEASEAAKRAFHDIRNAN